MLTDRQLTAHVGLEKVCILLTRFVFPRARLAGASRTPPACCQALPALGGPLLGAQLPGSH